MGWGARTLYGAGLAGGTALVALAEERGAPARAVLTQCLAPKAVSPFPGCSKACLEPCMSLREALGRRAGGKSLWRARRHRNCSRHTPHTFEQLDKEWRAVLARRLRTMTPCWCGNPDQGQVDCPRRPQRAPTRSSRSGVRGADGGPPWQPGKRRGAARTGDAADGAGRRHRRVRDKLRQRWQTCHTANPQSSPGYRTTNTADKKQAHQARAGQGRQSSAAPLGSEHAAARGKP